MVEGGLVKEPHKCPTGPGKIRSEQIGSNSQGMVSEDGGR